jgi:hypothetical protein
VIHAGIIQEPSFRSEKTVSKCTEGKGSIPHGCFCRCGRQARAGPAGSPSALAPHIGAAFTDRLQIGIGLQLLDDHDPGCTMFGRIAPNAPHRQACDNDAAGDDRKILLHCILRRLRKKQEECQIGLTESWCDASEDAPALALQSRAWLALLVAALFFLKPGQGLAGFASEQPIAPATVGIEDGQRRGEVPTLAASLLLLRGLALLAILSAFRRLTHVTCPLGQLGAAPSANERTRS